MKENIIRARLAANQPTVCTRIESTWPYYTELIGDTGNFDYIEFAAEYAPYTQFDLENLARAAELYNMGTMIKVDYQNRGFVAQKAVASGFQSVLFADHETPEQVRESVRLIRANTPTDGGMYGTPQRRFIGTQPRMPQMRHAQRLRDVVLCFMIEKDEAMKNIDEICSIEGVDMVQFGPSDYSMSLGWNRSEHVDEYKATEREMIKIALSHGVAPRCEIKTPDDAHYYLDLGVRHFSLGDQVDKLTTFWKNDGGKLKDIVCV
jgi:2-keto-3-deoxy-L-rhamnonate aldolase RhmA